MRFVLRGFSLSLDRATVERALKNVDPDPVQIHAAEVNGRLYPVKQALRATLATIPEVSGRLSALDFTSADARSILRRLGFRLFEEQEQYERSKARGRRTRP